nr:MAG TPA: hypothetical protein [Caudoviricetes sp.]
MENLHYLKHLLQHPLNQTHPHLERSLKHHL